MVNPLIVIKDSIKVMFYLIIAIILGTILLAVTSNASQIIFYEYPYLIPPVMIVLMVYLYHKSNEIKPKGD